MIIRDEGSEVVAEVDLRANEQTAGAQGGHAYHTGEGGAILPSGNYSWEVEQSNIDYQPASSNVSICRYTISVTPLEAGGHRPPVPCPCSETSSDGGKEPPQTGTG